MKRILFVSLMAYLVFGIAACGEDDEPIALVNDEEIMESDWQQQVDRMVEAYEQQGMDLDSEEGEMMLEQIEEQVLETLIQQEVLLQAAEDEGLEASDETVEEEIMETREFFETDEDFEDALDDHGFTEESFREMIAVEITIEKYFAEQLQEIEVPEEELKEMYEDYKEHLEEQDEEVPDFEDMVDDLEQQYIMSQEQEQKEEIFDQLYEASDIERLN